MTIESEIIGYKVGPRGRAPKSFPTGRVCAETDCSTRLSMYNRKDTCFRHSPIRFPRTRGRTKV
jgi:hypothetical protein